MTALKHGCSTGVFKERSVKAAARWVWLILAVPVFLNLSAGSFSS
jgi:hypothetical protein